MGANFVSHLLKWQRCFLSSRVEKGNLGMTCLLTYSSILSVTDRQIKRRETDRQRGRQTDRQADIMGTDGLIMRV